MVKQNTSQKPGDRAPMNAMAYARYMPLGSNAKGLGVNEAAFKEYGSYADAADENFDSNRFRPFYSPPAARGRAIAESPPAASIFFTASQENCAVCVSGTHRKEPFATFAITMSPSADFFGDRSPPQWFPFYAYNPDGVRRENITDWALDQFRAHYKDPVLSKWSIFDYVYGILHHPGYREKFADNLKRELPRIPFAPDFRAFQKAGQELIRLHLDYEKLEPWNLKRMKTTGAARSSRVAKMKLSKGKSTLIVNDSLSLGDIPPSAFEYRLGNRSALEWIIDQHQVEEDPRSRIKSDPNPEDDPEYIVRLVGQVVRVSVETVGIVKGLPQEFAALVGEEKP